jgi:elongation factor 1-beta
MSFGDVSSAAGLEKLNSFLLDNSYAGGWVPTKVDVELFNAIKSSPDTYQNVLRWWNNIASYKSEFASLPAGSASAAAAEEDDDDVDLFASDDEEDEEAERIKAERIAAYNQRKEAKESKKGKVIAKSNIILDIKPWDDETDLAELEKCIRSITMDGLLWGTGKLVPVGYGIKKLQITCVIEDDKVMMDDLEDQVTGFEDYVQSMDIVAFNKI